MWKTMSPPFLGCFYPILFILAGNEDMYKISDEFEFRPVRTADYRVSCSWTSKKFPIHLYWENGVSMLARSFLMESSSDLLLVARTGIKARSSSILDLIRPLMLELLALEWRKFHSFELEYLLSQLANLDQISWIASLGWGKGCIRFWGRLDQNSYFHGNRKPPLTCNGENDVHLFSVVFDPTLLKRPDLTLAHWTQVSDRCPLGYLLVNLTLS